MMMPEETARRYYRLGLGAAKRRDLSAALGYADFARILDPEYEDAARLAEICRHELGAADEADEAREAALERIGFLARQKKWKAAAAAAGRVSPQTLRLLNIQGCLWALAKRYAPAADCFARALAKDRGNTLAVEALACLGRRRKYFGRLFCFSLMK
jgi:tetratricopeptide (TPR) repeat protein